jgi:hypothetical protein
MGGEGRGSSWSKSGASGRWLVGRLFELKSITLRQLYSGLSAVETRRRDFGLLRAGTETQARAAAQQAVCRAAADLGAINGVKAPHPPLRRARPGCRPGPSPWARIASRDPLRSRPGRNHPNQIPRGIRVRAGPSGLLTDPKSWSQPWSDPGRPPGLDPIRYSPPARVSGLFASQVHRMNAIIAPPQTRPYARLKSHWACASASFF